jgi:hypothetical protein
MKHPDHVEKYDGTLDDLAKDIGRMRYDSVADFLEYLAKDLQAQADYDKSKERPQLSGTMYDIVDKLLEAKKQMDKAWRICEPYMRAKQGEE